MHPTIYHTRTAFRLLLRWTATSRATPDFSLFVDIFRDVRSHDQYTNDRNILIKSSATFALPGFFNFLS